METITGQKAVLTRAKNSVANFKIREGMPIGCKVTCLLYTSYYDNGLLCSTTLHSVDYYDNGNGEQDSYTGNEYTLSLIHISFRSTSQ